MLWFSLTIFAAFIQATADSLTKRALKSSDVFMASWLRNLLAVPFVLIALAFIPIPRLDSTFYIAVAVALPLETVATLLYTKAIEVSPLSLTMPFLALTPLYLILSSYLLLGEVPSPAGATGVVLIAIGAYLLNVGAMRKGGIFAPFKAVFREKGSLMMMAVAAIYAITSDLGKLAINHSSPVFFGTSYVAVFAVVFTPVALYYTKKPVRVPAGGVTIYVFIGLFIAVLTIVQPLALSMTQVSYMIAVKRTSMLFSIGYGKVMFGEENVRERLLGASVMLLGLVVMTVF